MWGEDKMLHRRWSRRLLPFPIIPGEPGRVPDHTNLAQPVPVKLGDGSTSYAAQSIILPLEIESTTYNVRFIILPHLAHNIIMGRNFLQQYGAVHNYATGDLIL